MAEAVAGLSLAANILQMVEYGATFVKTALKIYSSDAGVYSINDFKRLSCLSQDFAAVLDSLDSNSRSFSACQTKIPEDSNLIALSQESRRLVQRILPSLQTIGNSGEGKMFTKYEAVKAAFMMSWKMKDLKELHSQLDGMRGQLTLHLVTSLRSDAMESWKEQKQLLKKLANDQNHLKNSFEQVMASERGLGTAAVEYVAQKTGLERPLEIEKSLKDAALEEIYKSHRTKAAIDVTDFDMPRLRKRSLKDKFLAKLAYEDIYVREHSVSVAHEKTFEWIFRSTEQDRRWADFRQWLQGSDSQLYWITGKAGSGKSTLMRYLSGPITHDAEEKRLDGYLPSESRCSQFLQDWANGQPLIVASFYFWAVGSQIQRSREGMFRSLLYQILMQADRDIVAQIAPDSWEALCLFDEDPRLFSEGALQTLLFRALKHLSTTTRICLFVDGLDEFQGQHDDLIDLFKSIVDFSHIKICIASRPWQVFADAFQDKPSLMLQDLTYADIKTYVQASFQANNGFKLLRTLEPVFSDSLVEEVTSKADGVFLWVKLVVASLVQGLKSGDRVCDLRQRLDRLPRDLEDLFDRILDDLDMEYMDHAVQYFQLMTATLSTGVRPPNIMVFSYADEDEEFALKLPNAPIQMQEVDARRLMLTKRLDSRCMGLLEITRDTTQITVPATEPPTQQDINRVVDLYRVQYLHRTVKDYLDLPRIRAKLERRTFDNFDPHLRLCAAYMAYYKTLLTSNNLQDLDTVPDRRTDALEACLLHARQVRCDGLPTMVECVRMLESIAPPSASTFYHARATKLVLSIERTEGPTSPKKNLIKWLKRHQRYSHGFLTMAMHFELVEYVRARFLPTNAASTPRLRSITKVLSQFRLRRQSVPMHFHKASMSKKGSNKNDGLLYDAIVTTSPCLPIIEILLESGADLRSEYNDGGHFPGTIWVLTLMAFMIVFRLGTEVKEPWEKVVRLMIKYGAGTQPSCVIRAVDRIKALGVAGNIYKSEEEDEFCAAVHAKLVQIKKELRSGRKATMTDR